MKLTVIIEGTLLILFSLAGMAEGLRLVIYKDPYTLYDPLGPGFYVIAIGMGLMVLGIAHLMVHRRMVPIVEEVPVDRKMKMRLMSTVAACALYILLIGLVGYLPATLLFFLLEFRIQGIKSWRLIVVLSLVLSGLYYFIFVQYCNVIFPRGIVFR